LCPLETWRRDHIILARNPFPFTRNAVSYRGISTPSIIPIKAGLHPRNRHRAGYDFHRLTQSSPELASFVAPNAYGNDSINFADPAAVKALNQALLKADYGITAWDVPPDYLCPPIPGRADYLHYLADLLSGGVDTAIPRGPTVKILDVGVGANCIYPIIGAHEYGWSFVGTDTDPTALRHAKDLVRANATLAGRLELRRQRSSLSAFRGVVEPGERFAACICNPPFHVSAEEAEAGTQRKLRNLGDERKPAPILNFGGKNSELWCPGGELAFVRRMIAESAQTPETCGWFTTLISKQAHLLALERALAETRATEVRILPMVQGQKQSRIVAWRFGVAAKKSGFYLHRKK
jgi:23S rRNA (adenine1618-N6)-methyltransferase